MSVDYEDPRAAAKRKAAEQDAARLSAPRATVLPFDPSLPVDAQALRQAGMLMPLEYLAGIVNDEDADMRLRIDAAKSILAYTSRQPATKQEISVSHEEMGAAMLAALRSESAAGRLSLDEAKAMRASLVGDEGTKH